MAVDRGLVQDTAHGAEGILCSEASPTPMGRDHTGVHPGWGS